MQMPGPSICDLQHCFAHPQVGLLRRDLITRHQQITFMLLSNCPFEVFVAFQQ